MFPNAKHETVARKSDFRRNWLIRYIKGIFRTASTNKPFSQTQNVEPFSSLIFLPSIISYHHFFFPISFVAFSHSLSSRSLSRQFGHVSKNLTVQGSNLISRAARHQRPPKICRLIGRRHVLTWSMGSHLNGDRCPSFWSRSNELILRLRAYASTSGIQLLKSTIDPSWCILSIPIYRVLGLRRSRFRFRYSLMHVRRFVLATCV